MTRTERIPPNPNHYVGNHPLINSDQLDQYYPEPEDSRPAFPSGFNDASFHKGTVHWRPCPFSRKILERVIEQIVAAELTGGEHVIGYVQDQYRRNCKAATIRSAATAICLFLVFLKQRGIGKLEDIRRQHIGAFVEHEQDRGLKITSVRQKLQNVYAFMRYLSREDRVVPELLLRKIHLKLPQRLPRAIPAEDVLKLLSVIDRVRNRAIILLLLRTGMRIGEVLNLQTTDVDINERTVNIYEGEKNATGRVVCLSDDARQAMAAWLKARQAYRPRLFYSQGHSYLCYNGFFDYLYDEGHLGMINPVKKGCGVRVSRPLPWYLEDEQLDKLFALIRRPRDRAMFMLMLRCGLRVGEVARLTTDAVDLGRHRIRVESGKGSKDRIVYISNDAKEALSRYSLFCLIKEKPC